MIDFDTPIDKGLLDIDVGHPGVFDFLVLDISEFSSGSAPC